MAVCASLWVLRKHPIFNSISFFFHLCKPCSLSFTLLSATPLLPMLSYFFTEEGIFFLLYLVQIPFLFIFISYFRHTGRPKILLHFNQSVKLILFPQRFHIIMSFTSGLGNVSKTPNLNTSDTSTKERRECVSLWEIILS